MAKLNSLLMNSLNVVIVAILYSGSAQAGPIKTGGGNGAKDPKGIVVPLDMLFAEKVKRDVDIKARYPEGYRFFQGQVAKIREALPPLADDMEKEFGELKWNLSELPLTEPAGKIRSPGSSPCLNNMGIFRLAKGDRQVVLACQDSEGQVTVDLNEVISLREKRLMGVVFLHETGVRRLLSSTSDESEYLKRENKLITEINPYILANRTLDTKKLFDYALTLNFGSGSMSSPYTKYVDPETYRKAQELDELRRSRDLILGEAMDFLQALGACQPNDARLNSAESMAEFESHAYQKVAAAGQAAMDYSVRLLVLARDISLPAPDRLSLSNYHLVAQHDAVIGVPDTAASIKRAVDTCRSKLGLRTP